MDKSYFSVPNVSGTGFSKPKVLPITNMNSDMISPENNLATTHKQREEYRLKNRVEHLSKGKIE
jgi:hypothetical protein